MATLQVSPADALVDGPMSVVAGSLPDGERATLRASSTRGGQLWEAWAAFDVGDQGSLDTARDAPAKGSYTGADPTGLLWSLAYDGVARQGEATCDPWIVTFELEIGGVTVAAAKGTRRFIGNDVASVVVDDGDLRGRLFLPPASRGVSPVVVVTGSGGGLPSDWAALLASHGIPALALAHFGFADLPDAQVEIPLEYFDSAIAWVLEVLHANRLALLGSSMGGELALLLASRHSTVAATVSINGCGWVTQITDESGAVHSPWSSSGEPVPFAGPRAPWGYREAARISVERINGPVLLLSGGKDAAWTSSSLAEDVAGRLRDHSIGVEHIDYPDAGHLFGIPNLPHTLHIYEYRNGSRLEMGGSPAADARASADAFPRILRFLRTNLCI